MTRPLLTAVIAAHDERENLRQLLPRVWRALATSAARRELEASTILILAGDDGSAALAGELAAAHGARLQLIEEPAPAGLGAAFRSGFAALSPTAELVVTLDADLNHEPEEIESLLSRLETSGAQIVVGSRYVASAEVRGQPPWKSVLSRLANRVMSRVYGISVRDKTSGFRAYRAAVIPGLRFRNHDFAFLPEILILAARQRLRVVEAPIRFSPRGHGVSKMRILPTVASYLRLFGRLGGSDR